MSLIKKPHQLEVQTTIKALVYGQPGIGKTTLALSTPSPLLLDFDNGIHRVNPMHQGDTVQIKSWEDVENVLNEDLSSYKTLVIDTAGKMLDFMSAYLTKNDPKLAKRDGSLQLQGYGARKVMFINFLKRVALMGKHLVFVAHDKEEREGDQKIIRPEIGGSSAGDLVRELDLVGYMEAVGKKRTISFDPCEKFYGKNTCDLASLIELPDVREKANVLLSSIFTDYHKALDNRRKLAGEYADLMELIRGNLEEVTDAEGANNFVDWIQTIDPIWDSKLQAAMLLRDKTNELKLKMNKEKRYEDAKPAAAEASA